MHCCTTYVNQVLTSFELIHHNLFEAFEARHANVQSIADSLVSVLRKYLVEQARKYVHDLQAAVKWAQQMPAHLFQLADQQSETLVEGQIQEVVGGNQTACR